MLQATFYHAGCPVCVSAEKTIVEALDANRYKVDIVHLGEQSNRIDEARNKGVKSVPALLINDHVMHINHGADLSDLG
ncbi:MAG: thioredoxin family protein [Phycisphaeraceae bacterium]|mgnify:CR=1 FL=1|nr:thioredoxin family protein [Phycisphaeraceae bacterium]